MAALEQIDVYNGKGVLWGMRGEDGWSGGLEAGLETGLETVFALVFSFAPD